MKKPMFALAALTAVFVVVPASAASATTLGSTTLGSSQGGCFSNQASLQASNDPSTPYSAPSAGKITQWATGMTTADKSKSLTFLVLRPTGGGSYKVVGTDTRTLPTSLPSGGVASFTLASPITVLAGDTLGLYSSNGAICYSYGTGVPSKDSVTTASAPSPPVQNQTLAPGGAGQSPTNFTLDVSATLVAVQDVAVSTSTAPAKPTAGNLALLSSTVTNNGPAADPIGFRDTVPAGLTIDSATAGSGSCSVSGQVVTCAISGVGPGQSAPVNVVVTPQKKGKYKNSVLVTTTTNTDPNLSNNTASATFTVGSKPFPAQCVVPKLKRTPTSVARQVLKLLGCKVGAKVKHAHSSSVAKGLVIRTKPGPGTYDAGRKVKLVVSSGP